MPSVQRTLVFNLNERYERGHYSTLYIRVKFINARKVPFGDEINR